MSRGTKVWPSTDCVVPEAVGFVDRATPGQGDVNESHRLVPDWPAPWVVVVFIELLP
ncbi:MAG: hypothetical protein ACRDHM_11475 [Actinomycetota bacterium]